MAAYVDSSIIVAILLRQDDWPRWQRQLQAAEDLRSSPLLEAETRATLARERDRGDPLPLFRKLAWIVPVGAPRAELERVLAHGYVRGADLWHLACALVAFGDGDGHDFFSLDGRQRDVAAALGFRLQPVSMD